jgi:hypothetical protein
MVHAIRSGLCFRFHPFTGELPSRGIRRLTWNCSVKVTRLTLRSNHSTCAWCWGAPVVGSRCFRVGRSALLWALPYTSSGGSDELPPVTAQCTQSTLKQPAGPARSRVDAAGRSEACTAHWRPFPCRTGGEQGQRVAENVHAGSQRPVDSTNARAAVTHPRIQ